MIKVLHIIWSSSFGGIQKLVYELSNSQQELAHLSVAVLAAKTQGEFSSMFSLGGIPFYSADLKNGFDFSLSKQRKMVQLFSGFDILHFHIFNPAMAMAAIRSKKKIVFTEHGNFGFGRKRKLTDRALSYMKKLFLNNRVNFISFNSRFTENYAETVYRLTNPKRKVIYNGISFNKNGKNEASPINDLTSILKDKFVVGTSSRFAGFKKIERLLDAFSQFQENKNTVLLLVGDGILKKELQALAETLHIKDKTIFTGYRQDVRQYQQLMDACVFPSQNEPFGLVAVETLSLGKPTMVFEDGGGLVEIIKEISPLDIVKDQGGLVERLNFYYSHPTPDETQIKARIDHAKKFAIEKMVKEFDNVYLSLI